MFHRVPRRLATAWLRPRLVLVCWLAVGLPAAAVLGISAAEHWSFQPVKTPPLPHTARTDWARNPVDLFILARLEALGRAPSPPTDRTTWLRRVSLDLTGLPPTPAEVAAFAADASPQAADAVVDRLLASSHFGERMAQEWLDAARFADSNGYQVDRDREMWAWRDWVIQAFNRNQPFDQFTIEQVAGDLLPTPTLEQRVATGFQRNHMINEEGGIIPEEFLAEYCADRVETTGTVWLGLTMNCARCHDHKYDPVTQKDFYSLLAFFHNVPESGVGNYSASIRRNTPPWLPLPSPEAEAKSKALSAEKASVEQAAQVIEAQVVAEEGRWAARWRSTSVPWIDPVVRGDGVAGQWARSGEWVVGPSGLTNSVSIKAVVRVPWRRWTGVRLELARAGAGTDEPEPASMAHLRVAEFRITPGHGGTAQAAKLKPLELRDTAGAEQVARALDGKPVTAWEAALPRHGSIAAAMSLSLADAAAEAGEYSMEWTVAPQTPGLEWRWRVRVTDAEPDLFLSPEMERIATKPEETRTEAEQTQLTQFRCQSLPAYLDLTGRATDLRKRLDELDLSIPITLVMAEMGQPRATYVLKRGVYDKLGERVEPGIPGVFGALRSDLPRNRLGLARWLVDARNPLTARVTVNRLWQTVFGTGLVRTSEDFGTQGERPSHPELLDWLASEFVGSGWDVKRLLRLLVTSATYAQDSRVSPALRSADPENRWCARGPRHRLPAEAIRDQALAVSGLLVRQLGGPSVRPYHPPGLYEQVVAGSSANTYVTGQGPELFRRTVYTYWKRSVPNPALLAFDLPFRETCTVRRSRTTTPLQALNLLNDPTYVEAAAFLARRMVSEGGATLAARLEYGFRLVLGRSPRPEELDVLRRGWQKRESAFREDPAQATALLDVGEAIAPAAHDPVALAAYATVAGVLLNLDETVTKE